MTFDDPELPPAHPRFAAHFTHPAYDPDDGQNDDLPPFGSDEGWDGIRDWAGRLDDLQAHPTLRHMLGDEADEQIEERRRVEQPDVDDILIALGFTLLRFTGQIDSEGRSWLVEALQRQDRRSSEDAYAILLMDLESFGSEPGRPVPIKTETVGDAAADRILRGRRWVPWLWVSADFESLKLVDRLDWSWVRSRKKPYAEKVTWLRQQLSPWGEQIALGMSPTRTIWSQWWDAHAGDIAALECMFRFEPGGRERRTIRAGGRGGYRRVTATFVHDLNVIDGPPLEVAATARRHVADALTSVAKRLEMPPPPALPLTRREQQALAADQQP